MPRHARLVALHRAVKRLSEHARPVDVRGEVLIGVDLEVLDGDEPQAIPEGA